MAPIAKLGAPGNSTIMAHAAEFSVNDVRHGNVIAAGTHFETFFIMAHIAGKPQAVEPMGENNWTHTFFFGPFIKHYVAILPMRCWRGHHHTDQQ